MVSKPLGPKDLDAKDENTRGAGTENHAPSDSETVENLENGVQEVHDELRKATISQIILTILAVLAICYFAKVVLVTIFTSVLIAFILEPLVRLFAKIHIPRAVGSALAVVFLLGLLYGLSYFFYSRAVDFAQQLPKYTGEIRKIVGKYQKSADEITKTTQNVLPPDATDKGTMKVKVQQESGIRGVIGSQLSNLAEITLALTFIPFLVYFMLTWKEHARRATVRLFPTESRGKAYMTLGKISEMMHGFIVGNFVIGVFMAVFSGLVFAFLHLPYFYFLGIISGFLSLIPYLGVIAALLPPLATGIGVLHGPGIAIIAVTILGLHLFSLNVLYPKIIGGRLDLNPLAVTLGLLIWGWIWGAMGLILAVPVLGTIKIVCDNVEGLQPFGQWLGEELEAEKTPAKA